MATHTFTKAELEALPKEMREKLLAMDAELKTTKARLGEVEASIEGDELVVRCKIHAELSKSGKSLTIASSHGNRQTTARYNGKLVTVGLNAYVEPDPVKPDSGNGNGAKEVEKGSK